MRKTREPSPPRKPSSGSTTRRSCPSTRPGRSRPPKATKKTTDAPPARPVFVAIGLGANLGAPVLAVTRAARDLSRWIERSRLSPLYRTSPVGGPAQPDFVNAVLAGWTRLAPRTLLERMRSLERAAGRRRDVRGGPRTLDLDLLLYGDRRHRTKGLVLPHPRLAGRVFVLAPLSDLAPRRVVPGLRKSVARLLREARAVSSESVRPLRAAREASACRTSAANPRE